MNNLYILIVAMFQIVYIYSCFTLFGLVIDEYHSMKGCVKKDEKNMEFNEQNKF